jgi:hypothetical protein
MLGVLDYCRLSNTQETGGGAASSRSGLLDAPAKESFSGASVEVRAELLEFYGRPDAPYATKRNPKDWARVQAELEQLKKAAPLVVPMAADVPAPARHIFQLADLNADRYCGEPQRHYSISKDEFADKRSWHSLHFSNMPNSEHSRKQASVYSQR